MEAKRQALQRDFRLFLCVAWRHLGLPEPTPVQYDIAHYLQVGPRRKMVMAFRGVGKSWIFSAYIVWSLWRAPDLKVLVVSASKGAADQIAAFVRRLIGEIAFLRHLRPRRGQRDGRSSFDVGPARAAKDPSLRAVGIGGQITGARADAILADDVETRNNALTAAARAKLSEQIKEFDAVLRPGGSITYLGTPQSFESLYRALPERGYQVRIWPAETPRDVGVYENRLAPFVRAAIAGGAPPGAPLDPARFSAADLAERRASYGPSGYALQFLLDARPADDLRFALKLSDVWVADLAPDLGPVSLAPGDGRLWTDGPRLGLGADRFREPEALSEDRAPFGLAVMAVDPSGRGADETAFAVVKELNGLLFLTASGGLVGGYEDEALERIALKAREQKAGRLLVESNFGDGMFLKMLKPWFDRVGWRVAFDEVRSARAKEQRLLETLEPVLTQRRLVAARDVVLADAADAARAPERTLFFQLTRLTPSKGALAHDDRLDALAMAIAHHAGAMARAPEHAAAAARARAMRTELGALGAGSRRRGQSRFGAAKPARARRW